MFTSLPPPSHLVCARGRRSQNCFHVFIRPQSWQLVSFQYDPLKYEPHYTQQQGSSLFGRWWFPIGGWIVLWGFETSHFTWHREDEKIQISICMVERSLYPYLRSRWNHWDLHIFTGDVHEALRRGAQGCHSVQCRSCSPFVGDTEIRLETAPKSSFYVYVVSNDIKETACGRFSIPALSQTLLSHGSTQQLGTAEFGTGWLSIQ